MTQAADHNQTVVDQHTRQAQGYAALTRASGQAAALDPALQAGAGESDKALDVACGPGSLALQLARRVAHVTAIDITPAMLDQARAAQESAGATNVEWLAGDAAALPFEDAAFDIVASRAAFHHFAAPATVLSEMTRVCRRGGRVMVIDVTPDQGKCDAYDRMERLRDPSHGHAHSVAELTAMAERLGLRNPQVQTRYSGPMAYAAVLATSFPDACTREDLHDLMARDADGGLDELGFRAQREDDEVLVTYPMSTLVWTRD